jgi:hypothetical protein
MSEVTAASKKPAYLAYHVRDTGDSKGFWTRVGAAWKNRDDSLTVQLDCLPIDGRVVLRLPKENSEAEAS